MGEESKKMKDLPDAVHTDTKTENLLCPKCPKEFDKIKTNPAKWKDMLRCHIGLVHGGKDLADKARSEYDGNKCKACGKISKDNTNKKKHMLFHHTKYVDLVLKEVEHAIKKHYGSDTRQNIKVKPLEKLLKPQEDCNIEQSEATDPKRKMGAKTEEINKKAKLDIEVTNDFADVHIFFNRTMKKRVEKKTIRMNYSKRVDIIKWSMLKGKKMRKRKGQKKRKKKGQKKRKWQKEG